MLNWGLFLKINQAYAHLIHFFAINQRMNIIFVPKVFQAIDFLLVDELRAVTSVMRNNSNGISNF